MLQEAAALPPLTPGSAHAGAWCDTFELQPATPDATVGGRLGGSKRRRLTGHAKAGVAAQRQGSTPQAWLPQAEQVVQRFDQQLSKLLAAALDACGSGAAQQGGSVAAGNAASAQQSALGLAETVASRALILQPFVQDRCVLHGPFVAARCVLCCAAQLPCLQRCAALCAALPPSAPTCWRLILYYPAALYCRCAEAAEGIAASLGARLLALPAQQAGSDAAAIAGYAPVATQALVLGRVALGMASRSSMLPLVLGSPDRWHAAVHSGSSNGSAGSAGGRPLQGRLPSGVAPAPPAARFERLQQRLHSVGLQAYGSWAAWASEGLADALTAGLASDPTLAANAPLRCWEETVIGGGGGGDGGDLGEDSMDGGGGGGSGLEMRFQLPAAPSPAAVQLALAACQEIDRAGGHRGRGVRGVPALGVAGKSPLVAWPGPTAAPLRFSASAPSGPPFLHSAPPALPSGGHLLEEEPLLLLKWRLGGSLLAALTAALAEAGEAAGDGGALAGKLSEKGVLQVLFDARFLLDLLSGGRPVSAG